MGSVCGKCLEKGEEEGKEKKEEEREKEKVGWRERKARRWAGRR